MLRIRNIFHRKPHHRKGVIVFCILAILLGSIQIWFVNNAEGVLKRMVYKKSAGKLKLELSDLNFNFFSNKLQVREGDLVSTDSLGSSVTYRVKFRKLTLKVRSFWPLLLNRKLFLDSIKLHDPEIEILRWRRDTTSKGQRDDLSLAREMGKIYKSMIDVLEEFGIRRIVTNNASVSLVNKMKPGSAPITLSRIYLNVVRTPGSNKNFAKDESVDLTTSNQQIGFPGGRHKLSFKTFNLQLFRKRIQLDSCTVTARAKDNANSYRIFFKKLMLVGVDFDAMYEKNLIRADSVYCEDPLFDIGIGRSTSAKATNKARPDPEKIVRELTGDFDLAYVGVKNAGIQLKMTGAKTRSIFNSHKDNFEMRGLRVSPDSSVPVVVKRFDMLMRGYKLYNEDSSVSYTFDSIHFINKKILLSNFKVLTASNQNKARDRRDFTIPKFELTGLDWYELVFDQNIKAQEAKLHNPVINFTKTTPKKSRAKTNLFAFLQNLDTLMTLDKVDIVNGEVNLKVGAASSVNVRNANVSVYSNRLLRANTNDELRRSVDRLSFSGAVISLRDFTAQLSGVKYTGTNNLHANQMAIGSKSDKVKSVVNDVYIDNLLLDEETETITADGLRWNNATVALKSQSSSKGKKVNASFDVENIAGNNTTFVFSNGKSSIKTNVSSLSISSLTKNGYGSVKANGLSSGENKLSYANDGNLIDATFNNLVLDSIVFDNDREGLVVDGLRWNNATLRMASSPSAETTKTSNNFFNFKNINGNNTSVELKGAGNTAMAFFEVLQFSALSKFGSSTLEAKEAIISAKDLYYQNAATIANAATFRLSGRDPAKISLLEIHQQKQNDTLSINIPNVEFSIPLNDLLNRKMNLGNIVASAPQIAFRKWNVAVDEKKHVRSKMPFNIASLTFTEPSINIAFHSKDSTSVINIPPTPNGKITASGINLGDTGLLLKSLLLDVAAATFTKPGGQVLGVANGKVEVDISNIKILAKNGKPVWNALINKANIKNPSPYFVGKKLNTLNAAEISVGNIYLSSESSNNKPYVLGPTSWVQLKNGLYTDSNYSFKWFNSDYNFGTKTLRLDSVSYSSPPYTQFEKSAPPDYTKFTTNAVTFTGFEPERPDSFFKVTTLQLTDPFISVYNTNMHIKRVRSMKPLPVNLVKKIARPWNVEQVEIVNGRVLYTEKDNANSNTGAFVLAKMNGSIYNIKNRDIGVNDSLALSVNAYMMDTALVNINIKESYTDTLEPFLFSISMKPTSMKILNPVLAPLSNVMIKSGTIDSLQLYATANDSLALGLVKMNYRDLKIKLLNNGNLNSSSFKNKLISFFANTFVIKRRSNGRTGAINFDRYRDRSFFNYLIKIAVSGLSTSVGIKKKVR